MRAHLGLYHPDVSVASMIAYGHADLEEADLRWCSKTPVCGVTPSTENVAWRPVSKSIGVTSGLSATMSFLSVLCAVTGRGALAFEPFSRRPSYRRRCRGCSRARRLRGRSHGVVLAAVPGLLLLRVCELPGRVVNNFGVEPRWAAGSSWRQWFGGCLHPVHRARNRAGNAGGIKQGAPSATDAVSMARRRRARRAPAELLNDLWGVMCWTLDATALIKVAAPP